MVKIPFERLTPSKTSTLSPFKKPVATVKPGEEVEIETWDARAKPLEDAARLAFRELVKWMVVDYN